MRKTISIGALAIIVGMIVINDQATFSRSFMREPTHGVSRLDDESIDRALASTLGQEVPKAQSELAPKVTIKNNNETSVEEDNKLVAAEDASDVKKPSDQEPVTLYLYEADILEKVKVGGKEINRVEHYTSDTQFMTANATIQGTLEYQYDYIDDQGVPQTVLRLEANFSDKIVSIGPIFLKDKVNVNYKDSEGNLINGEILASKAISGEQSVEFFSGDYQQYKFTFCLELIKCSEGHLKSVENKEEQEVNALDLPIEDEKFETVMPEVLDQTEEQLILDKEVSAENVETSELPDTSVPVDQEAPEVKESREMNSTNVEGSFDSFIEDKVQQPDEEAGNADEQKATEVNNAEESSVQSENSAEEQQAKINQEQTDNVVFSDAQIESDKVLRFKF